MSIVAVGTNHKYSPIAIRERFTFLKKDLREALVAVTDCRQIKAAVILSTCNRVEIYAHTQDTPEAAELLKNFLAGRAGMPVSEIEPCLYTYIGKEALKHLSRVASGLDSQIIGEVQILEQVACAYEEARRLGVADRLLERVFAAAIRAAQQAHARRDISHGRPSIVVAAGDLIRKIYGSPENKRVLIIGTGKVAQLVAQHLKAEQARIVFVAHRNYARASLLASLMGAEVSRFERLPEQLACTDVVISATASPHFLIRREALTNFKKPLLLIDLALPRDIDPAIGSLDGVRLFNLDDLGDQQRAECLSEGLKLEPEAALLP